MKTSNQIAKNYAGSFRSICYDINQFLEKNSGYQVSHLQVLEQGEQVEALIIYEYVGIDRTVGFKLEGAK